LSVAKIRNDLGILRLRLNLFCAMKRTIPACRPMMAWALLGLFGCSSMRASTYEPPSTHEAVNVEYLALDKYYNSSVRISLLTRPSCSQRPHYARLADLNAGGLLEDGAVYRRSGRLPANELLNIHVSNVVELQVFDVRSYSLFQRQCANVQSYRLDSGRKYLVKVYNWSTQRPNGVGFGCGFSFAELDNAGNELRILSPLKPNLPVCAATLNDEHVTALALQR
jgi:hypothetical protein